MPVFSGTAHKCISSIQSTVKVFLKHSVRVLTSPIQCIPSVSRLSSSTSLFFSFFFYSLSSVTFFFLPSLPSTFYILLVFLFSFLLIIFLISLATTFIFFFFFFFFIYYSGALYRSSFKLFLFHLISIFHTVLMYILFSYSAHFECFIISIW